MQDFGFDIGWELNSFYEVVVKYEQNILFYEIGVLFNFREFFE